MKQSIGRKTQNRQSLYPRGCISLTLPSLGGAPMRKQVDSILLSTVARQVALATARQEMLDENSKFGLFVCCRLL